MQAPTRLSQQDQTTWLKLRGDFSTASFYKTLYSVTAVFLVVFPLIVLACSSLTLMLPGVNAMRDIIQPAFIPSILTLWVSLPVCYLAVKYSRATIQINRSLINEAKRIAVSYHFESYPKEAPQFIIRELLDKKSLLDKQPLNFISRARNGLDSLTLRQFLQGWSDDYKDTPSEKPMGDILEETQKQLFKPKDPNKPQKANEE